MALSDSGESSVNAGPCEQESDLTVVSHQPKLAFTNLT